MSKIFHLRSSNYFQTKWDEDYQNPIRNNCYINESQILLELLLELSLYEKNDNLS